MFDVFIFLSEMANRWEFLEADPSGIINVFIYLLLFILIVSFLWISLLSIEITVKVPGLLKPVKDSSLGRNLVSGKIQNLYFSNGEYVSKGQLLYEIESENYRQELKSTKELLSFVEEELKDFDLLLQSINQERNLFNRENPDAYIRQTIAEIQNEINPLKNKKFALDLKIDNLIRQIENCKIRASISGYIQNSQEINPGDYMVSGVELFRIFPINNNLFQVDVFVPNSEITGISEGDVIHYHFPGFPEKEYGVFKGKVISIPENSLESGDGNGIYLVQGSLDSKKDNCGLPLRAGMHCDSRIVVREQKIIDFLFEKLDLKRHNTK